MEQDLFKTLPSEIITNILLRLPIRSIASSKCVCKPWLDLLETDDFVDSHLSKSVPSLAIIVSKAGTSICKAFEIEDEADLNQIRHRFYNPLTKFSLPHRAHIHGSLNGLLLLSVLNSLRICNPISRTFIELDAFRPKLISCGFGETKISGKYKVVRICRGANVKQECYVHTLGSADSWRSVGIDVSLSYRSCKLGAFVNGNLHGIVSDSHLNVCVSCFDLETECFSTFCVPPPLKDRSLDLNELCVLKDRLCLFDNASVRGEIGIWMMQEYGVEKSWSKEYVSAANQITLYLDHFIPIKVFKNGDILMSRSHNYLIYYSSKTKTIIEDISLEEDIDWLELVDSYCHIKASSMTLTPSFLSFKRFGMNNIMSY